MPALRSTPPVFTLIAALVEEKVGLHYGPLDAEIFLDRVSLRGRDRGFDSLLDYYYFLRYDPEGATELDALVEVLVVGETYFFRELRSLEALVEHYLVPAIARGIRPRIWCAAAATGEEPLTLAMLLARRGLLDRVELWASDISERALAQAQQGLYGRRSLRAVVPGYERWLRIRDDHAVVDPELVRTIHWFRWNLVAPALSSMSGFDAILCRNVLIYFTEERTASVVTDLVGRLLQHGVLMVGVSESLLSLGTLLRCEERGGAFFYEKVTT